MNEMKRVCFAADSKYFRLSNKHYKPTIQPVVFENNDFEKDTNEKFSNFKPQVREIPFGVYETTYPNFSQP